MKRYRLLSQQQQTLRSLERAFLMTLTEDHGGRGLQTPKERQTDRLYENCKTPIAEPLAQSESRQVSLDTSLRHRMSHSKSPQPHVRLLGSSISRAQAGGTTELHNSPCRRICLCSVLDSHSGAFVFRVSISNQILAEVWESGGSQSKGSSFVVR